MWSQITICKWELFSSNSGELMLGSSLITLFWSTRETRGSRVWCDYTRAFIKLNSSQGPVLSFNWPRRTTTVGNVSGEQTLTNWGRKIVMTTKKSNCFVRCVDIIMGKQKYCNCSARCVIIFIIIDVSVYYTFHAGSSNTAGLFFLSLNKKKPSNNRTGHEPINFGSLQQISTHLFESCNRTNEDTNFLAIFT